MNKELIRLLREIAEVSGKLYSNTSQGKDLRVYKGTKRLAELAEEGASAEEAEEVLRREGLILSAGEIPGLVLYISVFLFAQLFLYIFYIICLPGNNIRKQISSMDTPSNCFNRRGGDKPAPCRYSLIFLHNPYHEP